MFSAASFPLYILWRGPNDAFQRDAWVALTVIVAGNYVIDRMVARESDSLGSPPKPLRDREKSQPSGASRARWTPADPLWLACLALPLCGFTFLIKPTSLLIFLAIIGVLFARSPRSLPSSILLFLAPGISTGWLGMAPWWDRGSHRHTGALHCATLQSGV